MSASGVEVVHLEAARASGGGAAVRELGRAGDGGWRVARVRMDAAGDLVPRPGLERILVLIDGQGLEVRHGEAAPRARLHRLEPYRCDGGWPAHAVPGGGRAEWLEVLVPSGSEADVEALRLGRRRAREVLVRGDAFLHALHGRGIARVTGAEQPFRLAAGDSLAISGLSGGEELELSGGGPEAEFLLVRLGRARERDDRGTIG